MFTIEELVLSAFSGGSLDLEAAELAEMTNVLSPRRWKVCYYNM